MKTHGNYVQKVTLKYINDVPKHRRVSVLSPANAAEILRSSWDDGSLDLVEEFKAMYMNNAMEVLAIMDVSKGTLENSLVDIRHVFAGALLLNASKMIISHNHPSGLLIPSKKDMLLTGEFIKAGEFMKVEISDHIIIGREDYYSFGENDILINNKTMPT